MEIAASHPASPDIVALLLAAMERDYSAVESTYVDNESNTTPPIADALVILASPPTREILRVRYPGSRAD